MYQKNITQNIEPAMASPASLQRAAEMEAGAARSKAEALGTAIGAIGTAFETKTFMDMRQLQVDSEALANEFLTSGKAAEVAGKTLPVLEDVISFDENVGPLRNEDFAVINNMKSEANRLRSALEGGMSNVQYEARVSDLTRKYLARYPGMSDKIRQVVSAATGLPGADRWAASQYVQDRFSPQKSENSDAMIKKDIDFIVANKPDFSYEELYTMRANGDPRYYQVLNQAKERAGVKALNDSLRQNLETGTFTTVPALQDEAFNFFEGQIAEQLVGAYDTAVAQGMLNGYLDAVRKGNLSADELVAMTQSHTTNMMAAIDRAYANAKNAAIRKATRANLNKAQQDEMLSALNQRYESEKLLWGDKNSLLAQALVEQKFAGDTLDKKLRLVQATTGMMANLPRSAVESYFNNPDVLKATNPDLFNIIDSGIKAAGSARGAVIDSLGTSRNRVGFSIQKAAETGAVDLPPSATAAEVRAVHQGVATNVKSAVEVINKSPAAVGSDPTLTSNMVRNMEALFTGITPQGGAVTVAKDVNTINNALKKLSPDDLNTVKAAASTGSVTTVNNIKAVLLDIEREFGVMPQLGVNDAGELAVLNWNYKDVRANRQPGQTGGDIALFNASKEAVSRLTPMLQNLVNTRLIVEDKTDLATKTAIAREFGTVINNRQPYNGFFGLNAKPIATSRTTGTVQEAPATAPTGITEGEEVVPPQSNADLDQLVTAELQKMKQKDPDLNIDYIFNAYQRSSPEEKTRLAEQFRANNITMGDISGSK